MEFIKTEKQDEGLIVTLARPDKRNAFHPPMIKELTSLFEKYVNVDQLDGTKWLLLRGEGKSFCAGADLEYMKSMATFSTEENYQDSEELFNLFKSGFDCKIPVLADVHGHVMGGGLGLVALSDIAVAAEGTQFSFSEVRLGLVPAVISSFVLAKTRGPLIKELLMSGRLFTNEEAYDAELITHKSLDSVLKGFAQGELRAIIETKRLIRNFYELDWDSLKETTCRSIADKRSSEEAQDRIKTFLGR